MISDQAEYQHRDRKMISREDAYIDANKIKTTSEALILTSKIYDSIGSCETCSFHGNLIGRGRTSEHMCFIFKAETSDDFYCKAYEEK